MERGVAKIFAKIDFYLKNHFFTSPQPSPKERELVRNICGFILNFLQSSFGLKPTKQPPSLCGEGKGVRFLFVEICVISGNKFWQSQNCFLFGEHLFPDFTSQASHPSSFYLWATFPVLPKNKF